jgi:hypothetical protein
MTRFEQILARLGRTLDGAGIPYMIIGGQAVLIHGRLRVTEDVDLTLGVDSGEAARVLARKQGKVDREYLRHWIRQFAQIEGKGHLLTQLDELLAEA